MAKAEQEAEEKRQKKELEITEKEKHWELQRMNDKESFRKWKRMKGQRGKGKISRRRKREKEMQNAKDAKKES